MDRSEESFAGYTDGDRWNGFACPYFSFNEAVRLLEAYGNRWRFDEGGDAFVVWAVGDEPEVFEGRRFEAAGEGVRVYPIGAYSWIWEERE